MIKGAHFLFYSQEPAADQAALQEILGSRSVPTMVGRRIVAVPPADYPYGERQYTVKDPGGHYWTFSQTIADIDPETWSGQLLSVDNEIDG